jgi:DNA polymerase/3'-5' exonuclease PolX
MRQLFENAIKNIEELLLIRGKQIELLTELDKSKEAMTCQFKIKSYKIWINLLRGCINKGIEIKSKEDIQTLKLTKSLEHNLIELFETSAMQDLEKAQVDLSELEKIREASAANLFSSVNSHTSQSNLIDTEKQELQMHPQSTPAKDIANGTAKGKTSVREKKEKNKSVPDSGGLIDTSKIEAQPKILSEEQRPSDARGGAIFDLRYVYGIGPKNAEKLVDSGITLEGLLEDWTQWVKSDPANANLMISKMPIPGGYTRNQWLQVPEERQHTIQMTQLTKRLEKETRFLGKLNSHQLLGVKWFHDMSQKIPRSEVQCAERILKAAAKHMNADLQITLCGSYRRGRPKSGDIDCLITHPGIATMAELESYPVNILAKFVELLTNLDFLIDHLTDYGRSKYMGFCMIKQSTTANMASTSLGKKSLTARRIDIRFIPYNSYGTAILYFTGSKLFNTQMRTWAIRKGYSLNEYGLKKLNPSKDSKEHEIIIPCKTEEEVFRFLDYPYKTPEQRDI